MEKWIEVFGEGFNVVMILLSGFAGMMAPILLILAAIALIVVVGGVAFFIWVRIDDCVGVHKLKREVESKERVK